MDKNKYWANTLKELKRLALSGLINEGDVAHFYSHLDIVSDRYKQSLETIFVEINCRHPIDNTVKPIVIEVTNNGIIKAENDKLIKALETAKQLYAELMDCNHLSTKTIPPFIDALRTFTDTTSDNKPGKGKQIKLSKHKLFRVFELLFYHYTKNAKINKSFLLANEFMLAAGYEPDSSNEKGLNLRKQNFDEAREALERAGISDNDLFFRII